MEIKKVFKDIFNIIPSWALKERIRHSYYNIKNYGFKVHYKNHLLVVDFKNFSIKYDEDLYNKPRWLVLNKLDMLENSAEKVAEFVKAYGWKGRTFATSAISGVGCKELVYAIMDHVEEVSAKAREEEEAEQAKLAAEKLARKEAAALKRAEGAE